MSDISSMVSAAYALMFYVGIFLLIVGLVGNALNIIIFLSLKSFRKTTSVIYLIVASFLNTGQLLSGLTSRILFNGLQTDWTLTSQMYCKFRAYLVHFFAFSSLTCISIAIIDQFLATSVRPYWQQLSSAKTAYYLSGFSLIFWIIYLSPHLVYYELIIEDQPSCTIPDPLYSKYVDNFLIPVVWYILPFFICVLFGLLAYHNIKQIAYRTVPLLRRRIDEQLSIMILVQVIINIFATLPYIAFLTITSHVSFSNDPLTGAQLQLLKSISLCLYYLYPSSPFYVYICASERFRRQLHYVLIEMHWSRWQKRRIHAPNQVSP